jgi:hypothetical protein
MKRHGIPLAVTLAAVLLITTSSVANAGWGLRGPGAFQATLVTAIGAKTVTFEAWIAPIRGPQSAYMVIYATPSGQGLGCPVIDLRSGAVQSASLEGAPVPLPRGAGDVTGTLALPTVGQFNIQAVSYSEAGRTLGVSSCWPQFNVS